MDTLGGWVGKENSKAQRQDSSVPLAEQEGFGLSEVTGQLGEKLKHGEQMSESVW